jgi:hypothetical protein
MCPPPDLVKDEEGSDDPTTEEHDDESEWDPENNITIRAKWTMDSAKTLDECIEKLQNYIKYLGALKEEGWELINAVDDDYGFLRKRQST